MNLSILNGRVIDPAHAIDAMLDIYIDGENIIGIGAEPPGFKAKHTIDACGKIVCPGLVDIAANLREPGYSAKGTLETETAAAAKGGITTLVCTPCTHPVIDTPAVIELIQRKARKLAQARVLTTAALTRNLDGERLSDMVALRQAGAVAFTNAHHPLANTLVERRTLEYAATFDYLVLLHPEDRHLRADGCIHEGAIATRLGLPGIPEAAESVAVARDLALAEHTGARIHFRSLSTARSIRMLHEAHANQLPVSADVAAHQLHLTEQDIEGFDTHCHVWPPLRTLYDRNMLRQAVRDGLVKVICSDHQPHDADAKNAPLPSAAPGISGLETLLALVLRLVDEKVLDLQEAIARVTCNPADLLDLPYGRLKVGQAADICIFDPNAYWKLDTQNMLSKGKNTPFAKPVWEFRGQVTHTLFNGEIVYKQSS